MRQSYETYKRRLQNPGGKSSPVAKNDFSMLGSVADSSIAKKKRLQAEGLRGQFTYKFKEGQSKNFK